MEAAMSKIEKWTDLNRRSDKTLCNWLRELNHLRWPNELPGPPEHRDEPGRPRRREAMNEILSVLGWRVVARYADTEKRTKE
jgi:hypothetical protein